MMQVKQNNTVKKLRYLKNTGRKLKNLPVFILLKKGWFFMEEKEIVLSEEMEKEFTNGKGEEE